MVDCEKKSTHVKYRPNQDSPTITFVVTPVNEATPNNGTDNAKSKKTKKKSSSPTSSSKNRLRKESTNSNNYIQDDNNLLKIPTLEKSNQDSDSLYGDTFTSQTSITRVLAEKFKEYREVKLRETNHRRSNNNSNTTATITRAASKHSLISKYESQDYDACENVLFMKQKSSEKSQKIKRKWLARWLVMCLIGVGTAMVAIIIGVSIDFISEYKYETLAKLTNSCEDSKTTDNYCLFKPLLTWVLINSLLASIGSMLIVFLEPQASGSGIAQIKCYLNGVKIPGLLTFKGLVAKSIGVILSVTGGLVCGKEGPMIHCGSIVAAGISQGRSKWFRKDFKIFEYLRSDTERRDFISGGAAAGVAAAFGAPVGGVLFSLEEGASFWNQVLTWRILFASITATFVVNFALSALHGHVADMSNPGLISFGKFTNINYRVTEIPVFLIMGVIGGLLGAAFCSLNAQLVGFRRKNVDNNLKKVLETIVVAILSAVFSFVSMYFLSGCYENAINDDSHKHHKQLVQLRCPYGKHNMLASIFFKTPEQALVDMLHDPPDAYSVKSLIVFVILYLILMCLTCGLSVSTGFFIPSLLIGAAWGRLVGILMRYLSLFETPNDNLGIYVLVGAASQLGGTVRMTISLTVMLIECTGDVTFGLPVVMVLIVAKWVGDLFNSGLYDQQIEMMGIPLLPWEPPELTYDLTAENVMNKPVAVFKSVETVDRLARVLQNFPHSGFPVVESYVPGQQQQHQAQDQFSQPQPQQPFLQQQFGICKGLVLKSQLLLLLKKKCFKPPPKDDDELMTNDELLKSATCNSIDTDRIKLEDFRDTYQSYIGLSEINNLTEEERKCMIDLRPYMNPSPYTVTHNTSLPRMFKLFRGLGLRHLIIVNYHNQVVGMVTRKDLAKYKLKSRGGNVHLQKMNIHWE